MSGVCLGGGTDKLRSIMALTVTPRPGNKIVSIGLAAEAKDIADAKKLKCKLEQFTKVKDTYTIAINMSQGLPGVPDCGVKVEWTSTCSSVKALRPIHTKNAVAIDPWRI